MRRKFKVAAKSREVVFTECGSRMATKYGQRVWVPCKPAVSAASKKKEISVPPSAYEASATSGKTEHTYSDKQGNPQNHQETSDEGKRGFGMEYSHRHDSQTHCDGYKCRKYSYPSNAESPVAPPLRMVDVHD